MAEMVQGTAAWLEARCGRFTASRGHEAFAFRKDGKPYAARENYIMEVVAERLTGYATQHFVSSAMMDGQEREPQAADAYAFLFGADLVQVGFVEHPRIPMSGASPDRLVGDDGLLEIKAPTIQTHLETLLCGEIPKEYLPQMRWQLACTGRKWCDFASWHPHVPPHLRLWVKRLHRNDDDIRRDEEAVIAFLAEVDARIDALNRAYAEVSHDRAA